jgi:hypothetical protein
MQTTIGCIENSLPLIDFTTIPHGSFRVAYSQKKSKTIEFFEDLYTYPPQFRVKWNTIDELHEDLFMSYNYRVLSSGLPFMEVLTNFSQNGESGVLKKTNYSFNSYLEGYLNKITSTRLYSNQAKKLQDSLQYVPIYTILNGQGEIVLATSTDKNASDVTGVMQTSYDFCGRFDSLVDSEKQVGLFFMSKQDAQTYLNEIAKSDTQGTKMFGLSIHCFGLDFAYRITREYHPNVDFRFIPNLNEVQTLLTAKNTSDSSLVFDDNQQQLRFRRRSFNILPFFNKVNKKVSPFSSFFEKTEYFKGVPIYVVRSTDSSSSLLVESCYHVFNLFDTVYSRCINCLGTTIGFGNNRILQNSFQTQTSDLNSKTYVFFEKEEAKKFCQQYKRNIARYKGNKMSMLGGFVTKPKIFVHNLEDFLEICEEKLLDSSTTNISNDIQYSLDVKDVKFIPAKLSSMDLDNYLEQNQKAPLTNVVQFFDFKVRRLFGFFELLLNTN